MMAILHKYKPRLRILVLVVLVALPFSRMSAQQVTSGLQSFRTLHTPHFQVHFPEQQRAMAGRVARIAERVHARLEPKYQSGADNTHIVLVFDTDTVNAFATPFGLDQIVLFMESPRSGEFSRYDLWVELLLIHEYTHIITLRKWSDTPSRVFLRVLLGIPPDLLSPFGMIEGTAVYEESQSDVGRLNDPLTRMIVRSFILDESYPSPSEILNGSHRWPGFGMGYLFGGRFVNQIAESLGPDAVPEYWLSNSLPINPDGRIRGSSVAEIYERQRAKDEQEFIAEIDGIAAAGVTPFERLTEDGQTKRFLIVNDQGQVRYFASPRNTIPGLFQLEEDGPTRIRRQLASNGISEANGRAIYSEDYFMFSGFGLRYELYDPDNWFFERIASNRHIGFPSLTTDGNRLLFVERTGIDRSLKLARLDGDDLEEEEVLLRVPYTGLIQYTAVAPDNSGLVALMRFGEEGNGQLVYCSLVERNACRVLVSGPGTKVQPRFSKDGAQIFFASDVDGVYNIYSVDVSSGAVSRRTRVLTGAFYPAPGDSYLYALQYYVGGYEVARVPYDELISEPVSYFKEVSPRAEEELRRALEWEPGAPLPEQPSDAEAVEPANESDPDDDESNYFTTSDDEDISPPPPGEGENDEFRETGYWGPLEIRPYMYGLFGPVSALNLAVGARDPMLWHNFFAGVGAGVPDPYAIAFYDYNRFPIGLSLGYTTNYWKRDRAGGCIHEEGNVYRFLCDDSYWFFEEATAYLRHTSPGRYLNTQVLLGYKHQKLRNARRIRTVEIDARDLNLSGPSAIFIAGDVYRFAESISNEKGWLFSGFVDYYTSPESKERLDTLSDELVEYGVAQGGFSLYLPSFWDNHVNYFNAYGYGVFGPDRDIQEVRLNRFVRGQDYSRSESNHSAAVVTYEYRLPLVWYSRTIFRDWFGTTLRNVGLRLFLDYGASFDLRPYREDWYHGAYGASLTFGFNLAYLRLPEMRISYARGTGPAGEGQVTFAFSAEFGSGTVNSSAPSHPVLTDYHRGLPGFEEEPGYFRHRLAGGVLD